MVFAQRSRSRAYGVDNGDTVNPEEKRRTRMLWSQGERRGENTSSRASCQRGSRSVTHFRLRVDRVLDIRSSSKEGRDIRVRANSRYR